MSILGKPSSKKVDKLRSHDDYVDNLKNSIENKCYTFIVNHAAAEKEKADEARAVITIASNLERIGDFFVHVGLQTRHFKDLDFIQGFVNFTTFFDEINQGLDKVFDAVVNRDSELAMKVCRSEPVLDELTLEVFHRILDHLRLGDHVEDLMTTLFIIRYLERAGDSLLNIGEAVINTVVGERLKLDQFTALREGLSTSSNLEITAVDYEPILNTRSGCRIGKIEGLNKSGSKGEVIFKQGASDKLSAEKDSLDKWEEIMPGLVPKVQWFKHKKKDATILLEYLNGYNFKQIVLEKDKSEHLKATQERLFDTLKKVWKKTLIDSSKNSSFTSQLIGRLDDVFSVHSELKNETLLSSKLDIKTMDELIEKAREIEEIVTCPFTVLIHGDFNLDNVIFNPKKKSVHFIDVHRSRHSDYVQDISVFLVSLARINCDDPSSLKRMSKLGVQMYLFAKSFAKDNKDKHFDARLALGLIRSYITSTRFQLEESFAEELIKRAVLILEKLHESQDKIEKFSLPEQVLNLEEGPL